MKRLPFLRNITILAIILCNIGCDQVSKTIVRQKIGYNESIGVIRNHFTLTKVENSGAFLSLGDALPSSVKFILLSLLPLLALSVGVYAVLAKTNLSRPVIVGICFVIGGGMGNLYDRVVHGSVTDFMHLKFGIFQTGIFNMADVSIMFGMLVIALSYIPAATRNSYEHAI